MRISDWSSDVCSSDLFRDEIYHSPCQSMRDNPIPNALSTKVLFPELGGARGALYFPAFPPLAWVHRGAIQWRPCLLSGSHVSYPSLPYPLSDYTHGAEFARLLAERILILDGAMGPMIQQYKLSEMDFRGERFEEHLRSEERRGGK